MSKVELSADKLKPALSAIPLELRKQHQWLIWKEAVRNGKPTKIPFQARDPYNMARVNDPLTWANFNEAVGTYTSGKANGVGFVFSAGDPYCGVDLDDCINPTTGEIYAWALAIVEELNGYTELSPSRTGLHIIVRGKLPKGGRRKDGLEFYDQNRFFTMTGWVVDA